MADTTSAFQDIYLSAGLRTPFTKGGGALVGETTMSLSIPVAQAMANKGRPDALIWGQVIPDPTQSNIARELIYEAGLDPTIPAFSTVLACSSSFVGMIQAAGMIGHGGMNLILVGGAETMSHLPIALKAPVADKIISTFAQDPDAALKAIDALTADDFLLPIHGWANKQSGRSQGEHTEDTAKTYGISREDQDRRSYLSHMGALKGQDDGFFKDLIVPVAGVDHDMIPRRDTSPEKLAKLPPVFDRTSGKGTITAGNASPITDGAASLWVGDTEGLKRIGNPPAVKLVDWEIAAMRYSEEGILMAPARAIPRLLARHGLRFEDIQLWEIHEAFAAQVLANIKAASDPAYRRAKAGVDFDLGDFSWERVNPHGGSLSIGHPFAATGARILSQAAKELAEMASGSRAIVSVCADGGQGTVALLQAR